MPYILPEERDWIAPALKNLTVQLGTNATPGVLNYLITELLLSQYPASYGHMNELIGVLECAKHEFYRRVVVPYEEVKRNQNGDVYD